MTTIEELCNVRLVPSSLRYGKICRIYCRNFVTYKECVLWSFDHLNILIGPNGTGKSTLMSAMVLGFGGETEVLSRSSNIVDYIKNGEDSSYIEIMIFVNDTDTVTFSRSIDKDGKSVYKIDSNVLNKKNYLDHVNFFKIQPGNMCQFLPQDRVQDFSKMDIQQLFEHTLKSVGSNEVIEQFKQLKEYRKKQQTSVMELSQNTEKYAEYAKRLDELKKKLDRYNTRKSFSTQIDVCNLKKMWVVIEVFEKEMQEKKEIHSQALQEYHESFEEYKTAKNAYNVLQQTKETLSINEKNKLEIQNKSLNELNKTVADIEKIRNDISREKWNLQNLKKECEDSNTELSTLVKIKMAYEQDLKNAKEALHNLKVNSDVVNSWEEELSKTKIAMSQLTRKICEVRHKIENVLTPERQALQMEIDRIGDIQRQVYDVIRKNRPNLMTAIQWVEDNKEMFAGKVYNPLLMEINVSDSLYTKYFENTIKVRDLFSFACEQKSDLTLLTDELCTKRKLGISVFFSAPAQQCKYTSPSIEPIKKYGFIDYLLNLIDGPPALLNYLCSMCQIHRIPIGIDEGRESIEPVPASIRQYFKGDFRYNVAISKYSEAPSLMQIHISSRNILISKNKKKVETLEENYNEIKGQINNLRNECTKMEAEVQELEFRRESLINKKRDLNKLEKKIELLQNQIVEQIKKMKTIQNKIDELPAMESKFSTTMKAHVKKLTQLQLSRVKHVDNLKITIWEKELAALHITIFKRENESTLREMDCTFNKMKEKEARVRSLRTDLEKMKTVQSNKINAAKKMSNGYEPNDKKFPNKFLYDQQPTTIELLTDRINDLKGRLECMDIIDSNIVNEYEEKSKSLVQLKELINSYEKNNEEMVIKLKDLYIKWYPSIEKIVADLNENFCRFMRTMGCIGEIVLVHNDKFDFDSYGIQIMVQFRKSMNLQPLSRHLQSGGERAVAIALYSLSLQNLSGAPFRCVDEINQGMDPQNERYVFEMLVKETSKPGQPQYFFITPKLLENLPSNPYMAVHILFSGKFVETD